MEETNQILQILANLVAVAGFVNSCYLIWQVYLGSAGALDIDGKELPRLVYVSREKRPGYQHHKKAGAMNALVSSYILTH